MRVLRLCLFFRYGKAIPRFIFHGIFQKSLSVAGFINTCAYARLLHCNRQNIQESAQIIPS